MTQQLGAKANHSQITFVQLLYLIFVSSVVNHVVGISFKIIYLSFLFIDYFCLCMFKIGICLHDSNKCFRCHKILGTNVLRVRLTRKCRAYDLLIIHLQKWTHPLNSQPIWCPAFYGLRGQKLKIVWIIRWLPIS